jgi:hypothetical protein
MDGVRRKTVPCGKPVPVDKAVFWSIRVVQKAMRMIIRSLFGRLKPDPNDPLVTSVLKVPGHKRIAGVFGAMVYLFPPIPFIASIISNRWLNRRATVLLDHISETLDKIGTAEC